MLLFDISAFGVKALSLIGSLSILVVLHEFGHYWAARRFNIRVNKFYLFFDFLFPMQDVAKFSLFKKKIGDTEYGIGWFPFGGYVDIAGMVDETKDEKAVEAENCPEDQQFRFKKPWQRLIVMIGGVVMNLLLAIVLYFFLLWVWGEEYLPMKNVTNGISVESKIASDMGLQTGDKILQVDGKPAPSIERFVPDIILNNAKTITVDRNGQTLKLNIPEDFAQKVTQNGKAEVLIAPRIPIVIADVVSGSNAQKAGLEKGDKVVSVNGIPTEYFDQFKTDLDANKGKTIKLMVERNNQPVWIDAKVGDDGKLGFQADSDVSKYFKTERKEYGFFQAIPAGIKKTFETLRNYFKSLGLLFKPKGPKLKDSVGGFYSMGKIFPSEFTWEGFWSLTALLSVVLAFMNILPIPMLDGGYVLFLLYEIVRGKPLPVKVQNFLQTIGFIIILGMIISVNALDIPRMWNDIKSAIGK